MNSNPSFVAQLVESPSSVVSEVEASTLHFVFAVGQSRATAEKRKQGCDCWMDVIQSPIDGAQFSSLHCRGLLSSELGQKRTDVNVALLTGRGLTGLA
jgi:hypothetical protein